MRLAVRRRCLGLILAFMTAALSGLALNPLAGIAQENEPKPSVEKGAAPAAGQSLSQLGWLAGTWHSESQDGTIVEEQWLAPRGSLMLGVNRTVTSKGRTMFEYLRIGEKDGALTYFASPSGAPATPFRATQVTGERATFENPDNDFPQKIEYWLENKKLRARIEGVIQGQVRSMEWTWNRVP